MAQDWNEYADRLQKQLPAAPERLLDGYVRYMPWVSIIFGAIGVLAGLALLLLGAVVAPLFLLGGASGVNGGFQFFISIFSLLISGGLGVAGGYLMLQRSLTGWWLLALSLIVDALGALLTGNIFNVLVLALVAYVHLSVKPRYS
ncbi:MAG: hypothetical protein QOF51_3422 [Chloroflexota bacterium]|jgi:hypothetical protein|nr:hypothetical protein [Chloroflexota bacterium]